MISYATLSKEGDRYPNEDYVSVYKDEKNYVFALADGLGGHGRGEVASRYVAEQAVSAFQPESSTEENLRRMFEIAQNSLREKQRQENAEDELKSTLVLLVVQSNVFQYGYVGDSRCYQIDNRKEIKRTLDHSVPQILVLSGEIKEKNIRNHPDRNRLLKVMGMEWDRPKYDLGEQEGTRFQSFLLCSDGFWELILEKQILKCLKKSKTPQEWLKRMEEIVKKNGKNRNMDNYSAIAVWCD